MKTDITYVSIRHYNLSNIRYWIWHSRKYTNVKGITFRILGLNFNIREKDAREKLIAIFKAKKFLSVKG